MLADTVQRPDPRLDGLRETFSRQREGAAREHGDEIASAIARDFGHHSHHETRLLEIFPSLEAVKHAPRSRDLPFGGVGPSGMGQYHGRDGFDTFSKRKGAFRQTRLNAMGLFKPPYGKRFDRLVSFLLR